MLHNFCEVETDLAARLRKLNDPLEMRASERIIQFPFVLPVVEEKTEEELARIAEKRKEQGRKLQEMAAKTRIEKVCTFVPSCFLALTYERFCVSASAKRNRLAIPDGAQRVQGYREQAGVAGMFCHVCS